MMASTSTIETFPPRSVGDYEKLRLQINYIKLIIRKYPVDIFTCTKNNSMDQIITPHIQILILS